MGGQAHAEPLSDGLDRLFECRVRERSDVSGDLVDEVMVVSQRVGDLVARDAIAPVEPVEQAELQQLVERAIDRRGRSDARRPETVDDLLRGEQALALGG